MAKKKRMIGSLDLDKVDQKVIVASLKKLKLATAGSLDALAARLKEDQDKVPDEKAFNCTTCGGRSAEIFDRCPYCGDGEVDDETKDEADEVPEAKTEKAKKAAAQKLAKTKGTGAPMAVKPEVATQIVTEADLDKAVAEIRDIKADTAERIYRLGHKIKHLHDLDLWKLRQRGGKPKYENFRKFCGEELQMSHEWAYNLMKMARAFSVEDVKEIGHSKLGIVMKVPPKFQAKLLAAAKDGASKRDLIDQSRELRGATSTRSTRSDAPPAAPPPDDKITVVRRLGRVVIPLFKRPASEDEQATPARAINDDPWAREELENGILQTYRVTMNRAGEWQLVIEAQRRSAEQPADEDQEDQTDEDAAE
jgi:hypothetical protein